MEINQIFCSVLPFQPWMQLKAHADETKLGQRGLWTNSSYSCFTFSKLSASVNYTDWKTVGWSSRWLGPNSPDARRGENVCEELNSSIRNRFTLVKWGSTLELWFVYFKYSRNRTLGRDIFLSSCSRAPLGPGTTSLEKNILVLSIKSVVSSWSKPFGKQRRNPVDSFRAVRRKTFFPDSIILSPEHWLFFPQKSMKSATWKVVFSVNDKNPSASTSRPLEEKSPPQYRMCSVSQKNKLPLHYPLSTPCNVLPLKLSNNLLVLLLDCTQWDEVAAVFKEALCGTW